MGVNYASLRSDERRQQVRAGTIMMDTLQRQRAFPTAEGPADDGSRIALLAFDQAPVALSLADPNLPGCPLTRVNTAFSRLTGYHAQEVVGHNCRFLQGPATDPAAAERIAMAIAERRELDLEILNYRRDGTPFWNGLHLAPVHDGRGRVQAILASQSDVTELRRAREAKDRAAFRAREVAHRVKNAFQVIEAMVKLSARGGVAPELIDRISTRVRAIAAAHTTSLGAPHRSSVSVDPVVRDVLDPYQGVGQGGSIWIGGPDVHIFPGTVSVLALVLNELAAKAVRHGALSRPGGRVDVGWTVPVAALGDETEVAFTWTETGTRTVHAPHRCGEGTTTIDRLLAAAGGRIRRQWRPEGLCATLVLPRER